MDGASDRANRSSSRTKPAFERACRIIRELYPEGVPEQAAEPNAVICRRVGDALKAIKTARCFKRYDFASRWSAQIAQVTHCGICRTCGMQGIPAPSNHIAVARKNTGVFAETPSADWRDEHGQTFCLYRRASLRCRMQRTDEALRCDQERRTARGEARAPYSCSGERFAGLGRAASGRSKRNRRIILSRIRAGAWAGDDGREPRSSVGRTPNRLDLDGALPGA